MGINPPEMVGIPLLLLITFDIIENNSKYTQFMALGRWQGKLQNRVG